MFLLDSTERAAICINSKNNSLPNYIEVKVTWTEVLPTQFTAVSTDELLVLKTLK